MCPALVQVLEFVLISFFFQAEAGIRDIGVTGVQTCALPIWCRCRTPGTRCAACGPCGGRAPPGWSCPRGCREWLHSSGGLQNGFYNDFGLVDGAAGVRHRNDLGAARRVALDFVDHLAQVQLWDDEGLDPAGEVADVLLRERPGRDDAEYAGANTLRAR